MISANQFFVADYLGTMTLSTSSDNFFSQALKPRVVVNTVMRQTTGNIYQWVSEVDQVVLVLNGKIGRVFGSFLKKTMLTSNMSHLEVNIPTQEDPRMSLE